MRLLFAECTPVQILAGGILTTSAWDGQKGGELKLNVSERIDIEAGGVIDVSRLGFRGGMVSVQCFRVAGVLLQFSVVTVLSSFTCVTVVDV
jgi:hypothetical protein